IPSEETLGQYPILQKSTQRPRIRHGTERDPNYASHGRRKRKGPQTSGRNVQAWSVRSSDSISDGGQGQGENPDDRDKRSYQEGSRPSSRRVRESRQETVSNLSPLANSRPRMVHQIGVALKRTINPCQPIVRQRVVHVNRTNLITVHPSQT